jgi:hypothetical protein
MFSMILIVPYVLLGVKLFLFNNLTVDANIWNVWLNPIFAYTNDYKFVAKIPSKQSPVATGVSGPFATGVSGPFATGVSGFVATGVSGFVATGVSGHVATGVSGPFATGVLGIVATYIQYTIPVTG